MPLCRKRKLEDIVSSFVIICLNECYGMFCIRTLGVCKTKNPLLLEFFPDLSILLLLLQLLHSGFYCANNGISEVHA